MGFGDDVLVNTKPCSSIPTSPPFQGDIGLHRRSPILAGPSILTGPSILSGSPFRYMVTISELPSIYS